MRISLNSEQAKGLANFFFDVAKGLVLGGIGSAAVASPALLSLLLALCLSILLKNPKNLESKEEL